jgi:hypothetical protein
MRLRRGPRPLAIRVFAAAFLAAALLRLGRGLDDLPLAETIYAANLPWWPWDRDWTIVALSAEFTIALIPLVWIYLFAARFARWLVLGFGALRLAMLDPAALTGAVLVAIAMGSLLTPGAARWFARVPAEAEEDGPAVFE